MCFISMKTYQKKKNDNYYVNKILNLTPPHFFLKNQVTKDVELSPF